MPTYQQRLGGAAVCTVLVLFLGGWLLPKQPASSMASDWFWSNKAHAAQQFEVLALGDSRVYRGFSPDDFAAAFSTDTTLRVFNVGFSSAGLDTGYLRAAVRLLDTTASQPIIILGITTSSLADENAKNSHFWQEYQRSGVELWQRRFINPYLTFFDPSSPSAIRQQLQEERQGYFQTYYSNGWIASDKQPHTPWENDEHVRRTYPTVEFSLGLRQRLVQQIADWQAQGIQVVAFRPPAAPTLEALEMQPSYYPEKALKAEIQALGGIWLDLPNRQQYLTYDGNHLVEASARQLSRDVGQLLRQVFVQRKARQVLWRAQEDFEGQQDLAHTTQESTAPLGKTIQALPARQFSYTHLYALDQLPFDHLELTASVWVRLPQATQSDPVTLVVSVEHPSGMVQWEGQAVQENMLAPTTWTRVQFSVPYVHDRAECLLKAYIWNNSDQVVWLDGLTLEIATR